MGVPRALAAEVVRRSYDWPSSGASCGAKREIQSDIAAWPRSHEDTSSKALTRMTGKRWCRLEEACALDARAHKEPGH